MGTITCNGWQFFMMFMLGSNTHTQSKTNEEEEKESRNTDFRGNIKKVTSTAARVFIDEYFGSLHLQEKTDYI